MIRVLAVLCLMFVAPMAAPAPVEAGNCMTIAPICPPGLRPACICYDAFGNNCSWQCIR